MKTFLEAIKEKNNLKRIEECFILMEQNHISSNYFVEWYLEEGQYKNFQESAKNWLKGELQLVEGWRDGLENRRQRGEDEANRNPIQHSNLGQTAGEIAGNVAQTFGHWGAKARNWGDAVEKSFNQGIDGDQQNQDQQSQLQNPQSQSQNPMDQHVNNARNALNKLSKQLGMSKTLQAKVDDPSFHDTVIQLIGMMKNSNEFLPTLQPDNDKPPEQAPGFSQFDTGVNQAPGFSQFDTGVQQNTNYNPLRPTDKQFFESIYGKHESTDIEKEFIYKYKEKGQYLKEGLWDWARNTKWGNAIGNWWNKDSQTKKRQEYDSKAIINALNSIQSLEQAMESDNVILSQELKAMLDVVKGKLNLLSKAPQQQAPQQQAPQQAQQAQQAPQQQVQAAQTRQPITQQAPLDTEAEDWAHYNPLKPTDKQFFESIYGKTKKSKNWFS